MSIYGLKPRFSASLRGVQESLTRAGVTPDDLSVFSILVAVLACPVAALAVHRPLLWLEFAALVFVRLALNALDGAMARAGGGGRPWGTALNEFCDRAADALFLGALAPAVGGAALPLAAIVCTFFCSGIGLLYQAVGRPRSHLGPMGKADRMVVLAIAATVAAVSGAPEWLLAAVWIVIIGSAGTGLRRLRRLYLEVS